MTRILRSLLIIDVQQGIDQSSHWGGNRNNLQAEDNIQILLKHWRNQAWPVVVVQHCSIDPSSPFFPGKPGNALKDFIDVGVNEKLVQKSTTSAFVRTDLQQHLDHLGIKSLVITGFVTNNSVEATVRMGAELGYMITVVSDATAAFDKTGLEGQKFPSELVHQLSLANLSGEYATIQTTQQVLESET